MLRTSYNAIFAWSGPGGAKSAETEEVGPGIMLDFDERGEVIGVKFPYVSQRTAKPQPA